MAGVAIDLSAHSPDHVCYLQDVGPNQGWLAGATLRSHRLDRQGSDEHNTTDIEVCPSAVHVTVCSAAAFRLSVSLLLAELYMSQVLGGGGGGGGGLSECCPLDVSK